MRADDRKTQHGDVLDGRALDQRQREMRAHAGAQHLGRPQRDGALERDDLREAHRRRGAQDAADVARILQAIQHDRVRARSRRDAAVGLDQEADRRRRLEAAQLAHQRVGDADDLGRAARERIERGHGPAGLGDDGAHRHAATLQQRAAQVIAFEPRTTELAVRRGLVQQLAQILEQVVVARADLADDAHGISVLRALSARAAPPCTRGIHSTQARRSAAMRTGSNERRCQAQGPCVSSAARWAAVE